MSCLFPTDAGLQRDLTAVALFLVTGLEGSNQTQHHPRVSDLALPSRLCKLGAEISWPK